MLNPDGKCYSFDKRGSGYGRGEGIACVILKKLDDAISCSDPIRAVISNIAVNQDGKTSGITLPSSEAQASLQRWTCEKAAINPGTIGYVEAHGTGTLAGDVAEINAIAKVYGRDRQSPLLVGSVKANIGHLESVSGLQAWLRLCLCSRKH